MAKEYKLSQDAINILATLGMPSVTNIDKDSIIVKTKVDINPNTNMKNHSTIVNQDFFYNWLVYGAPGTGKSFSIEEKVKKKKSIFDTVERITFYPEYSHSMFWGSYKPFDDGSKLTYKFIPGPFLRVLTKAYKNPDKFHLLIIEEINRANAAAVFGDTLQLLDRNEDGYSRYSIAISEETKQFFCDTEVFGGDSDDYNEIWIPNNMLIWCTMNNADQGVFPIDTAFKRRWHYTYQKLNASNTRKRCLFKVGKEQYDWNKVRKALNDTLSIEFQVNEDKLLGQYFLAPNVTAVDSKQEVINNKAFLSEFEEKVLMYLFEDAAKRHRQDLFIGCEQSNSLSAIIMDFEKKGLAIFGDKSKKSAFFEHY